MCVRVRVCVCVCVCVCVSVSILLFSSYIMSAKLTNPINKLTLFLDTFRVFFYKELVFELKAAAEFCTEGTIYFS